jgi:hypothetical protein
MPDMITEVLHPYSVLFFRAENGFRDRPLSVCRSGLRFRENGESSVSASAEGAGDASLSRER